MSNLVMHLNRCGRKNGEEKFGLLMLLCDIEHVLQ